MGFLSQAGQVGFKTQMAKGSYNAPGGATANEVQTLTVTATGGTFTLTFDGATTTALAFDVSAAALKAALVATGKFVSGDLTTALSTGVHTITFTGAYAASNVPQLVVDGTLATGGTVVAATSTPGAGPGVFMRILSGALGGNRDLLVADPEIGGNRDITDAYLGSIHYAGQYSFYGRAESLATLLYGVLGAKASSSAGSAGTLVGTHVLTPADTIPWLSVEEKIANNYEVFNYTDVKVKSLHLEADAGSYLKGTVDLVGLTAAAGATATAVPHWDTAPLLVGTSIVVNFGGVALPAKSFKLDINNNVEDNDFRLGSFTLGDITEKRREIMMGVTIRPRDSGLWRQAMFGAVGATAPAGGVAAKGVAQIVITSYEVIGTSATVYTIQFDIPVAAIKPFNVSPSGDDVLQHDLEIQAFRPDASVAVMTATVKDHVATVV